MAIQHEVWARDLAKNLYPDNSFFAQGRNDDKWVSYKKVHLPQAGPRPEVVKNRAVFPAVPVNRVDTVSEYDLHEFTSTPTVIRDIEEIETSYDKRADVLSDHIKEINKQIANDVSFQWSGPNVIRTTGGDVATGLDGATGNRKGLAIDDFMNAKTILDDMDVDLSGRCVLLPAAWYNNMVNANRAELLRLETMGKAGFKDGEIMMLFGFKIFTRGKKNILRYTNAATPVKKAFGTANTATDNASGIFFQKDFVRRAKGAVKVYADYDKPEYYGSTFSAMARSGASRAYTDGTGVVTIVEEAAA